MCWWRALKLLADAKMLLLLLQASGASPHSCYLSQLQWTQSEIIPTRLSIYRFNYKLIVTHTGFTLQTLHGQSLQSFEREINPNIQVSKSIYCTPAPSETILPSYNCLYLRNLQAKSDSNRQIGHGTGLKSGVRPSKWTPTKIRCRSCCTERRSQSKTSRFRNRSTSPWK